MQKKRIPEATKIGSYWAIPENVKKPEDNRIKSGKYINGNKMNDLIKMIL